MPTAKTCESCGAPGQTGAFCDECGETLPETPAAAVAPAAPAAPADLPAPPAFSASSASSAPEPVSSVPPGPSAAEEPAVPSSPETPGAAPSFTPAPAPKSTAPDEHTRLDMPAYPLPPDQDEPSRPSFRQRTQPVAPPPVAPSPAARPPVPQPPVPQPPAQRPVAQPPSAQPPSASLGTGDQPKPQASADDRARDMLLRVNEPAPPPKENVAAPVLPTMPKPVQKVEWNKHQADPDTGGVPCPWCATPNPPGRHFCRRCAMAMEKDSAETTPSLLPWWRRMFDKENRPVPYAGQRPRLRRGPGQLVRLLITLAIVLLLIILASIFGSDVYNAIADHFTKPNFESPAGVTASNTSALPGGDPNNLIDRYSNTYWGTGNLNSGGWADITLNSPSNLLDVIVTPGAGKQPNEFITESSPKTLTFTMTTASGQKLPPETVNLPNTAGAYTFPLVGNDVKKVRVDVGPANPVQGAGAAAEIAISGIEFFGH